MLDITLDDLNQLPKVHTACIPETYMDDNNHMNVMWYMHLFDRGTMELMNRYGIDEKHLEEDHGSAMILESHIRYMAEVRLGEQTQVFARMLDRNEKRFHFMLFMVNSSQAVLASTFEAIATHVDLKIRRSSPFPPSIALTIDQAIESSNLSWPAPVCGVMGT